MQGSEGGRRRWSSGRRSSSLIPQSFCMHDPAVLSDCCIGFSFFAPHLTRGRCWVSRVGAGSAILKSEVDRGCRFEPLNLEHAIRIEGGVLPKSLFLSLLGIPK